MKIVSSSLLFCFIIITSTFALRCHSQGLGYANDLRIGRKEMRYGRALEEGQGLEPGHGQESGLGQGQGHGQEPGPVFGLGPKREGQGQEPGHEIGLGSEHGRGQGHKSGPGHAQGSEHGHGQSQGPEHGHEQTRGPEHGHEQTPGQGLGQSHGPEHGQTHGQEPPHGMGSGLGQGHGPEHGPEQGHGAEHGYGPGNGNNNKGGKVKGMFVFGSSLVDNGNNMFLLTIAKPYSLPYGIDFPGGPTGRFTNGKNVIDVFCDHLKLPQLPTFHDPSPNQTKNIINGVNFASGGSGIIDYTGAISGRVSWLRKQISNFEFKLLPKLEDELKERREEFLADYIFVIGVGGNDYTLNYFLTPIKLQSLEAFTKSIIKSLSEQIKKLYSLGARKFVLIAAYPLGCYPKNRKEMSCNDKYNEGATLYNFHLKSLIDNLTPQLPDSHFAFVDTYNIVMDLINNPRARGFKNGKDACCELRQLIPFKKGGLCKKDGHVCRDRNAYVFFDGIHPTQAVNLIIGEKAFHSSHASEVYPINLSKLSAL